jgi:hypothetical protein
MSHDCPASWMRGTLDLAAFVAVLVTGVVMILNGGLSATGVEGATYLTSLYAAWCASARRRSR